jgi:hypothetical protein
MAPDCRPDFFFHPSFWPYMGYRMMQPQESMVSFILVGAVSMASMIVSLFFLRFWKTTRDRFFLFFAAAFLLEGFNRFILAINNYTDEQMPYFFLIRLVGFILIICAIIDKNWFQKKT